MTFTLKEIAEWTHGSLDKKYEDLEISGFCADSRIAKPGQLFIPLVGDKFDGHDFIGKVASVCTASLSDRPVSVNIPVITVENTTKAYGDLARAYRSLLSMKVVGITGSVGKTSTKEMVACVLESKFRTAKSLGNHNNHIGLPETILDIDEDCEAAVLEMGMNHFGEMSYLTGIAHPDYVVITNIGTMHIEHLGSREGILKAKMEIVEGLSKDGLMILNGDEPMLWNLKGKLPYKMIFFGMENPEVDLRADSVETGEEGVSFHVEGMKSDFEVYVPSPGMHNVYNALASIALGLTAKLEPAQIQNALANYRNTGMRLKIYEREGFTIIEDCYNAGPESMRSALDVLKEQTCYGRKIAVLGDMLELGNISLAEHYKVGRLVARSADMLFAYGEHSERTIAGAITGGMPQSAVFHFESHEHMARMLRNRTRAGDLLLFKGSRGMRMEHVVSLFFEDEV